MPEDAPGNPGAVRIAGRGRPVMYGKVREMQAKLHRWAGQDQSRRFGDLFNLVCDPDFLAQAWFRVKANTGARTQGSTRPRWPTSRTGSGSGFSWTRSGTR